VTTEELKATLAPLFDKLDDVHKSTAAMHRRFDEVGHELHDATSKIGTLVTKVDRIADVVFGDGIERQPVRISITKLEEDAVAVRAEIGEKVGAVRAELVELRTSVEADLKARTKGKIAIATAAITAIAASMGTLLQWCSH